MAFTGAGAAARCRSPQAATETASARSVMRVTITDVSRDHALEHLLPAVRGPSACETQAALAAIDQLDNVYSRQSPRKRSAPRSKRPAPRGYFYPAVAVFRSAPISFCAQISAAPCTGSVLPGIASQPFFTSMSPRS